MVVRGRRFEITFRRCLIAIDIQGEITIQIQKHYTTFIFVESLSIWNSLLRISEITIEFNIWKHPNNEFEKSEFTISSPSFLMVRERVEQISHRKNLAEVGEKWAMKITKQHGTTARRRQSDGGGWERSAETPWANDRSLEKMSTNECGFYCQKP